MCLKCQGTSSRSISPLSTAVLKRADTLYSAVPRMEMVSASFLFIPVLAKWARSWWKYSRKDSGRKDFQVDMPCVLLARGPGLISWYISMPIGSCRYMAIFFWSLIMSSIFWEFCTKGSPLSSTWPLTHAVQISSFVLTSFVARIFFRRKRLYRSFHRFDCRSSSICVSVKVAPSFESFPFRRFLVSAL